ncbi:hypothetical protein [Lutibacter flavus]|uniref:Uncharacterized protein n=1 Tax=Lutibacter flavus TaxID=691689 RepID=A0A238YXU9_9FLAO|nr:hypothetical protein [Lutibacter flavus]SNR75474.1 hypothetical protein SAMN04488111_2886 [Lutibacter flavus]
MKKMHTEQLLENYLFDINILDNLYITLNKNKIDINVKNYKQYTIDVREIDYTKYSIITYQVGKNTILTILEHETIIENIEYETISTTQFLIKSEKALHNLKINDLTKYIDFKVADLVIGYLD